MYKLVVPKCKPLNGKIQISGAKNSALPIIAASLLGRTASTIENVPFSSDVMSMCKLIKALGAKIEAYPLLGKIIIDPSSISTITAPYELVNKIRASFLIMGPLVSKIGKANIPLPGGCPIGTRPVNLHLKGLIAMGAEINQTHGYVEVKSHGRLTGNKIYLDFPSVGATENIIMAASLASGKSIIENAATEPEIVDLVTYLNSMGAEISGAGTDTIKIVGAKYLTGTSHSIIPDRIEAGTLMVATAITGGKVTIDGVIVDHLKPVTAKLKEAGVEISEELSSIHIASSRNHLKSVDVKTLPYPGFPTDMQAQITSLLSIAKGTSIIIETIFENRFMHIGELERMGANIKIEGRSAIIEGCEKLTGAKVKATDLRAGAGLILAGLASDGVTEILDIEHVDRGYDKIELKLNSLGANIKRVEIDDPLTASSN